MPYRVCFPGAFPFLFNLQPYLTQSPLSDKNPVLTSSFPKTTIKF